MPRIILVCLSLLLTAAMPAPQGHVNDFANIIPDDREAVLEQRLRAYEAETTIEIAIVTTASLDGHEIEDWSNNLFRGWGIGKRDTNNGLLVVIAPNERTYRIEVGFGLEGDMTDARAGDLGREHLPDAFRAGDYAGGIENLTTGIINTLGRQSPEDRARNRAERERLAAVEAQEQRDAFVGFFVWLSCFIVAFAALFMFWRLLRSIARRRAAEAARKAEQALLSARYGDSVEELTAIEEKFEGLKESVLPQWMADDYEREKAQIVDNLRHAEEIRTLVPSALDSDLEDARQLVGQHESYVTAIRRSVEFLDSIASKVAAFRDETTTKVAQAQTALDGLKKDVQEMLDAGYRMNAVARALDLKKLSEASEAATLALANRGEGADDASDAVHADASALLTLIEGFTSIIDNVAEMRDTNARKIGAVESGLGNLPSLLDVHRQRLVRFKKVAPSGIYAPFASLRDVEAKPAAIRELLVLAKAQNGWEEQKFKAAATTIGKAERLLQATLQFYEGAAGAEREFANAKSLHADLLTSAREEISRAESKVADSDVGSSPKRILGEARSKLDRATTLLDAGGLVDWHAVNTLLIEADRLAGTAYSDARRDISNAEDERQRARRRREEEDRRRRNNDFGSGGSFGSSSSSSSSGSFGGFSGGDSGGAGASGDW